MSRTATDHRIASLRHAAEFYRRFAADYERADAIDAAYKARDAAAEIENEIAVVLSFEIPTMPGREMGL